MDNLKGKSVRSALWSLLQVAMQSVTSLVVFIVLTRLLDPHAFGLFALSTLFVDAARVLAAAGLADAVTRDPDLDDRMADTAFWANFGIATGIAITVSVVSYPYAQFMREPELASLIPALALAMPMAALGAIHNARLLRGFGHKAVAMRTMLATLAGGFAGITAAFNGMGVWSLVVQVLVSEALGLLLTWYVYRWVPARRFSMDRLRRLFGFSVSMTITQLFWVLLVRIPELFIGRFLGTEAVGHYRIAWRLIDLVGQAVLAPISNVTLVTLSHVQRDSGRFAYIYRRIVSAAGLFTYPVLFGFAAVADQLIPLVFGSQWSESAGLVRIFALMAVPFTFNYFAGSALAAKGDSPAILRIAALQFLMTVGLSLLAAPYGLAAIAFAYVFRAYLTMFFQMGMLQKRAGIDALQTFRTVAPTLFCAAAMAALVFLAGREFDSPFSQGWVSVAALSLMGAALYALFVLAFAREALSDAMEATGASNRAFFPRLHAWLRR